jgi:hypothetical protein
MSACFQAPEEADQVFRFEALRNESPIGDKRCRAGCAVETNLVLPDRCPAVFVDDTGTRLWSPAIRSIGLGGCSTLACALDRVIRCPWREIRRGLLARPMNQMPDLEMMAWDQGRLEPVEWHSKWPTLGTVTEPTLVPR